MNLNVIQKVIRNILEANHDTDPLLMLPELSDNIVLTSLSPPKNFTLFSARTFFRLLTV